MKTSPERKNKSKQTIVPVFQGDHPAEGLSTNSEEEALRGGVAMNFTD